jgi:hypothetical protein
MRRLFQDIFAYHHHFNQKLGDQILSHPQQITERMLFLFSHVILAHQVWNARILAQEPMELHQTLAMDQCLELDKKNFEGTWEIIGEVNLTKIIRLHFL